MLDAVTIMFWGAVLIIFYSYVGFSLLLPLIGGLLNRRVRKGSITPSVSFIIAAYNEEEGIAEKLENTLNLAYPKEKLEIIVASDGSDDATAAIVKKYAEQGVTFLDLPRQGKIYAVNEAIQQSSGEILVFSDANTLYDAEAVQQLINNYADPQVGGVCGNQMHINLKQEGDNISKGETLYWHYDKWLKKCETLTGSIVSADGAIYSIRRTLYRFPDSTAITDDFAISTEVIARRYRLVFESEALAYEKPASAASKEFYRKVRIMCRGLRGVWVRRKLLNPFQYGIYSLILFSHKLLRRLIPVFLILLLMMSMILSFFHTFYTITTLLQIGFYGWAFVSYLVKNTAIGRYKIFYIPFFYCLANIAALIAIIKFLKGERYERWQPQR